MIDPNRRPQPRDTNSPPAGAPPAPPEPVDTDAPVSTDEDGVETDIADKHGEID